jgi:hypothetical protein
MHVIVINLDYENNTKESCSELWKFIKEAMTNAGFVHQGRSFLINLPEKDANALARKTIDDLEQYLDFEQKHIHSYLKGFYGYPMRNVTNLLLPPTEQICVDDNFELELVADSISALMK